MSDEQQLDAAVHLNKVHIIGRLADHPAVRALPSGDEIVTVRMIVNRPPPDSGRTPRGSVDTFTCTAWSADAQRALRSGVAGETIEIHGALRRRFWRSASGLNNTYEVEVVSADRLAGAVQPA